MATHLSSGRVNIAVLREAARRELLDCLDKCVGAKALVWDEQLTGPLGLIAEYSLLKEHEVEKMFPLRTGRLPTSNVRNVIFITRPKLQLMEFVAQNIHKEEELGTYHRKDFHLFFVPRKSLLCEKRLKELGVYGTFSNVDEYNLDILPFDNDLLSTEMEHSFKECFLFNDMTSMYYVAKSLMMIHVADMMLRMRREMAGSEQQIPPQIDALLLIDRNVDFLTPLASQLTYEGLIDEIFGIANSNVKLPPEKFQRQKDGEPSSDISGEPKKFVLNSADELYSVLRDKNFHAVGPELSKKAKLLSAQFEERKDAKTVGEIKQFVSKLPHIQAAKISLANHTSIAELIKENVELDIFMDSLQSQQEFMNGIDTDKINSYIEDCISRKEPLIKVIRLICMQSITNNGFKPKVLEFYKREIIQTYGFEHIITIDNLEKAGLLRPQGQKSYSTIRKSLRLVVEDVNEQNPTDISYVFSGYAPLTVRLAQYLSRPGWRSIEEVLRLLPGPTIEEIQQIPVGLRKKQGPGDNQKVTLVFFLGGVTYAEIAALRFLSQQEDSPSDYIIATTKIINGSTFIKSIMHNLSPDAFGAVPVASSGQSR
uniref:Vacuolar protein sorting-associated protein 33A n=1 Tax=Saccoglossus kowalevskii TaxID=10224 RepID=A0ABM0GUN0_SACKO|nr:PREDICTED: vacuolar protein sorting-associated protein 33A [Saccoglossus kowalevskii]